jgi:hypothetical protein
MHTAQIHICTPEMHMHSRNTHTWLHSSHTYTYIHIHGACELVRREWVLRIHLAIMQQAEQFLLQLAARTTLDGPYSRQTLREYTVLDKLFTGLTRRSICSLHERQVAK